MYGELNHPNKPLILDITHNYPDIVEKTLSSVKQIKLFEFAKKYNLEDAELQFRDGCYYGVNHAIVNVDKDFPEQDRITLSE